MASLFIYKSIMFNATIIVVRQPSGYMVFAFHWQYNVDISLAIFCFTYYFELFMKNKYTIPYHTIIRKKKKKLLRYRIYPMWVN